MVIDCAAYYTAYGKASHNTFFYCFIVFNG